MATQQTTSAAQSRLTLARAAIRPNMRGRVMLSGPSGAGKTFTALVVAETLKTPGSGKGILVIDTEKESALTYADEFEFTHLPWKAPFDPRDLTMTLLDPSIEDLYEVVIVDSFSHFWTGAGGTLDTADGRYTGWKDARPMQADVVDALLECPAHTIACIREKMDHEQVQANGKWEVKKLGLAPVQDPTFEYEVNVSISIDMTHTLHVSKSRTKAVPTGTQYKPGHAADFAVVYRDWLAAGEDVVSSADVERLIETMNTIEDKALRTKAKGDFVSEFGRPEFILQSRYKDACSWVADVVMAAEGGTVQGAATGDRAPDEDVPDDKLAGDEQTTPDVQPSSTPEGPSQPLSEPQSDETASNGSAPEPAGPSAQQAAEDPRLQLIVDEINGMSVGDVQAALDAAGLSGNGSPKTLRSRLAKRRIAELASA